MTGGLGIVFFSLSFACLIGIGSPRAGPWG